ncbi:hypothetical protein NDU88_002215, partial [Pleurodeles waltl]
AGAPKSSIERARPVHLRSSAHGLVAETTATCPGDLPRKDPTGKQTTGPG